MVPSPLEVVVRKGRTDEATVTRRWVSREKEREDEGKREKGKKNVIKFFVQIHKKIYKIKILCFGVNVRV